MPGPSLPCLSVRCVDVLAGTGGSAGVFLSGVSWEESWAELPTHVLALLGGFLLSPQPRLINTDSSVRGKEEMIANSLNIQPAQILWTEHQFMLLLQHPVQPRAYTSQCIQGCL